jgi:hypothetical protein
MGASSLNLISMPNNGTQAINSLEDDLMHPKDLQHILEYRLKEEQKAKSRYEA